MAYLICADEGRYRFCHDANLRRYGQAGPISSKTYSAMREGFVNAGRGQGLGVLDLASGFGLRIYD